MTDEEKAAEIARLEAKLKARKDRSCWSNNCKAIEDRIAELKNGA